MNDYIAPLSQLQHAHGSQFVTSEPGQTLATDKAAVEHNWRLFRAIYVNQFPHAYDRHFLQTTEKLLFSHPALQLPEARSILNGRILQLLCTPCILSWETMLGARLYVWWLNFQSSAIEHFDDFLYAHQIKSHSATGPNWEEWWTVMARLRMMRMNDLIANLPEQEVQRFLELTDYHPDEATRIVRIRLLNEHLEPRWIWLSEEEE